VRIVLASDHAGRTLRLAVAQHLGGAKHTITDLGTDGTASVDYPDYAAKVAAAVARGEADLGILVCGTGIGMSMTANRVRGVRAAVCTNEFMARAARSHNDANVLCLGERVVGAGVALAVVDAFLETPFEGGRHARRVALIDKEA
jgi:ribose 5-phosphate isomerase B